MSLPAEKLSKLFGQAQPLRITDGITHRQLAILLREAAAEAGARVGTSTNPLTAAQARQAQAALSQMSKDLWNKTGRIVQAGVYQQAQLAADQALDLDLFSGVPPYAVGQYARAMHFEAAQAANDIISRRTEGFKLADRIYANGQVTTKQVGRIVEKALAQQLSARQLAAQVKGFYKPDVPGGASYAAMRLARTEINNAHHTTTIRLSKDKPWVLGFKWNLSGSHPKPDECNDYAERDNGQGPGIWGKDDVPAKPHPNCLCYLTHQMPDQDALLDAIANGEYDDYLESRGVAC